ncbi:MAG: inosine/xanthosine triphosphatase [Candidatus Micrarchaeia archaeon]
MKCILGGTFNILHIGHERLLKAALAFDEITIGLTSDSYARQTKAYPFVPYSGRALNLENFVKNILKKSKTKRKLEIVEIGDKYGFAPQTDADAIIVSSETESAAEEINRIRKSNRRKPLRIISVPLAYAEDFIKISAKRIHEKRIDLKGKRLKPVIFALGSANPSKKQGLAQGAKKIFKNSSVRTLKVQSRIREQPFEQETLKGAENRAKSAYSATNADFGIGFESGLFNFGDGLYDIAICAVFDGERTTFGTSMGFQMPKLAIELLNQHKDLGAAMSELTGIDKIGYKKGAIHYLSNGVLTRQQMNEQAFLCAMIPRISEAKNLFRYF